MKTRALYLVVMLAISITLWGCGGGSGGGGTSIPAVNPGGNTTPASTPTKVTLLSAIPGATPGQTVYTFNLPKGLVYGSKANPFLQTDIGGNAFVPLTQSSPDGLFWIGTVTTFDQVVKLKYGGDYLSNPISYADMSLEASGYYNAATKTLDIGFSGGLLYTAATMPTPTNPPPDVITLVTSAQDAVTKKYKYKWTLDMSAVAASQAAPFIAGDFNNWQNQAMTVNAGFGVYSTSSYNKLQNFVYGGNAATNSYASGAGGKSAFWDAVNNKFTVGMSNGTFKTAATFVPVTYGGTATDTGNVVGFTLNPAGDQLTIYTNLDKVGGLVAAPFWNGAFTSWSPQATAIIDANGWASITIPVTQPVQLVFGFGGDITAGSYANITGSQYFRANFVSYTNVIAVDVKNNTVVAATPLAIN